MSSYDEYKSASETGNASGSSLLSFFRGRKATTRSACASSQQFSRKDLHELAIQSVELPSDSSAHSPRQQSVNTVLEVLTTSQENLLTAAEHQRSPRASREGGFFSRSNSSVTAAAAAAVGGGGSTGLPSRDVRSSLLSRLLKTRSSVDSRTLSSATATQGPSTEEEGRSFPGCPTSEELSPSHVLALGDAGGSAEQQTGGPALLHSSSSSSSSMLQMQASMERKRSRLAGHTGGHCLSLSVDSLPLTSLSTDATAAGQTAQQQQQQSGPSPAGAARDAFLEAIGAECFVTTNRLPKLTSSSSGSKTGRLCLTPSEDHASLSPKALHGQSSSSSRGPCQSPATLSLPLNSSTKAAAAAAAAAHQSHPATPDSPRCYQRQQQQQPGAARSAHVQQLAAAFEQRCSATAAASSSSSRISPDRRSKPQSPSIATTAAASAVASTAQCHNTQQQQQQVSAGLRLPAGNASPFCTMEGQQPTLTAWAWNAVMAQQQQQLPPLQPMMSAAPPRQQQSVPLPSSCSSWDADAAAAACQLQRAQLLQQQQQQQQQQGMAVSSSFSSGAAAAVEADAGFLPSVGSAGSRGVSPYKPRPPPGESSSPQRSRPGMSIRQTLSTPGPAAQAGAAAQGARGSMGAAADSAGQAAGATAAAGAASAQVPGLLMPLSLHRPSAVLSPRSSPTLAAAAAVISQQACVGPRSPAVPSTAALPDSNQASKQQQQQQHSNTEATAAANKPAVPAGAGAAAAAAAAGLQQKAAASQAQQQQQQQQKGQSSPRQPQQQQVCSPIAIARHCPRDLQGHNWQPRDFVQTKKLYEGKIAAVVQGYHAVSGRPLALKVYNRARLDTMERFQLAREVCLHMRSCHPAITSLYAAYKDSRYIYLLMELAPSGNLYQMLMCMPVAPGRPRCLGERDAVTRVIKPLLSALAYLHDQGIIHRDIKLENVLLTADGCIKLADFGLSIDTRHEPANTRLGTQGYFAPEVLALPLKSSPFEGKSPEEAASRPSYDCKVDVWSAGVVCFEVLTGRAPFAAESVAQVLQAILHRQLVYPGHLSPDAVSFLSTALIRDPKARPTVRELLQHPFIAKHDAN